MNTRTGIVNALIKQFGPRLVDEITKTEYQAADAGWADAGYARKTREARLTTFRAILKQAQDDHLRYDDPTKGVTVYAEREREPRLLTEQELLLLLCFLPVWFWPAALLAHDCGLRAAEVCGLRWFRLTLDGDDPSVLVKDVMEPDRTLRGYPKGKKTARVALTPRVVAALRVLRASRPDDRDDDFVFRNSRNLPLRPKEPNRLLATAFGRSGLTGQRPVFHDLRHSCGDNLARHNASAVVIMNVLRHGNLKTSQGYIGAVSTREQREWMLRVQSGAALAPVVPWWSPTGARTAVRSSTTSPYGRTVTTGRPCLPVAIRADIHVPNGRTSMTGTGGHQCPPKGPLKRP